MKTLIATALIALSFSAQSYGLTGNDYLSYNEGTKTSTVAGMFIILDEYDSKVCFPEGVTVGQTRDMLTAFISSPQALDIRHISLASLYRAFMMTKFPCKVSTPAPPPKAS